MSYSYNYYLLTSLPVLGEPGAAAPLPASELRARAAQSNAAPLIDVILLAEDLKLRQSFLAGELSAVAPLVLSSDELTSERPPALLGVDEQSGSSPSAEERVWEAYWRYAARIAHRRGSTLLGDWIGVEVALRNALAGARARSLDIEANAPQVAPELGRPEPMIEACIAAWSGAPDPLTALRLILRMRWDWVLREEPAYTFSPDEVAAYALKLTLLQDWRRTMGAL